MPMVCSSCAVAVVWVVAGGQPGVVSPSAVVASDHDYERFAPLDPAGKPNLARGVREFVVGTGG